MHSSSVLFVAIFVIISSGVSCQMQALPKNPILLEISTRPWLYELSLKYGTNISRLADVPDAELRSIASLGYDYVYFMGMWKLGQYGLQFDKRNEAIDGYRHVLPSFEMADVIGSPFAVTDYTLNPVLGTDADLVSFKKRLNSMGLRLILDFVPNHSAVDAPEVAVNASHYVHAPRYTNPPYDPEYYMTNGIAYGRDPYSGGWKDTVQINYWNKDTVAVQISKFIKVASFADGIRCDMAMLLLNSIYEKTWGESMSSWGYTKPSQEFWSQAISAMKRLYPNVIVMAEEYWQTGSKLQSLGFDYTYDKDMYDRLSSANCDDIRRWIGGNGGNDFLRGAHFTENHDEERASAHFGVKAFPATVMSLTVPGMRFFNWNQLCGYKNRLDVHLRRSQPESCDQNMHTLYSKLLSIINSDLFRNGQWTNLGVSPTDSSWRMIAYKWTNDKDEHALVVVNYSGDGNAAAPVVLSDAHSINGQDSIPVKELLSDTTYMRSASDMRSSGLFCVLSPWQVQIFTYQ